MSLPHLILGLLNDASMSGYDLNKAFRASVQHFWTTDQSQIYRALHKLHESKLVDIELVEQTDSPDKKVYHISDAGRAELKRWVMTALDEPPIREAWLGQLFFGQDATPEALADVLQNYQTSAQARLQALEALESHVGEIAQDDMLPAHVLRLLTLEYGLKLHRFLDNWLEEAIERLRQLSK